MVASFQMAAIGPTSVNPQSKAKIVLEIACPLPPPFYCQKPSLEAWQYCCGSLEIATENIHFFKGMYADSIIFRCFNPPS